ncbi:PIN domain-containing protein [Methanospirillum sp.]|uniref:PIN domain-containing protein n=1 Tax=Methanospirillum sp. TaxID=45200 RepID=UPI0035A1446E
MYLFDTNIFFELLYNRTHCQSVLTCLELCPYGSIFMSDFSYHSIGLILFNNKKKEVFALFCRDIISSGKVHVVALSPVHTRKLIENSDQFKLDFDDAYQLTVSMTAGLTLVSYDSDFDTVPNGRVTPEDLLILLQ